MQRNDGRLGALWIAAGCALLLALPAAAQNSGDRDTREINGYRLTDAALGKYTQAQARVAKLAQQSPGICDDADEDSAKSIDQLVAKLDATAGVRAAIQSAGMTTREYVIFSLAVFQAGMADWALSQPGAKLPAGVAMENATFYRQHQAAMKKMGETAKASECKDGDDD